jgi:hypothetical protein
MGGRSASWPGFQRERQWTGGQDKGQAVGLQESERGQDVQAREGLRGTRKEGRSGTGSGDSVKCLGRGDQDP